MKTKILITLLLFSQIVFAENRMQEKQQLPLIKFTPKNYEKIYLPTSCQHRNKISNVSCGDFLNILNIKNLKYQGCEKIEASGMVRYEAVYSIKSESASSVEKELKEKIKMEKFTSLTAVQLTTQIARAYFCADKMNIHVYAYLKDNPLGMFGDPTKKRNEYDYIIEAIVFMD